ncbi:MAG: protein-tyrosine phosphatase family protein [Promethearchaeota archaeon]
MKHYKGSRLYYFKGIIIVRPWYWPKGGQPHRTEEFTWIIKEILAASWWPDPPVFERYKKENISVIINCSEFDNKNNIPDRFIYYHINVPDFGLPTEEQIEEFLKICDIYIKLGKAIVVHCVGGCGRTAQFIVAWAANNGFLPKGIDPVRWIRKLRPCSLETREQMENARKIAKKYQK